MNTLRPVKSIKQLLTSSISEANEFFAWLSCLLIPLLYGSLGFLLLIFFSSECHRNTSICTTVDPWVWPLIIFGLPVLSVARVRTIGKNGINKNMLAIWLLMTWALVATSIAIFVSLVLVYGLFN
jgi:hypothetical protein